MNEQKRMEIESYILNFKMRHTEVLKRKLDELHEEEAPDQLQSFYSQFLKHCRDYLHQKLKNSLKKVLDDDILELLKVNFYLAELSYKFCSEVPDLKTYPLTFSEDIYECLSLQELQDYFSNLQTQVPAIQKFQDEDKYVLLRISNSMLKRLSTTHDTHLRGLIQIFLTQIFSTIHPSLRKRPLNSRDRGFEDEKVSGNAQLPYSFYKNFWTLQKYLNNSELIFRHAVEFDDQIEEAGQIQPNETQRTKNLNSVVKVIMRTLQYFKEQPIEQEIKVTKRFPKFLTKYSLFKNQLKDPYFRRLFLNQILLFVSSAEVENQEKQIIQNLKIEVQKQLEELGDKLGEKVQHLIDTERTWRVWIGQKQCFNDGYEKLNIKASEKTKKKRQEMVRKIYEDMKYKPTDQFNKILSDQVKAYKIETSPIEPGLNFYLNEVIYQMDPNRRISDSDRCKNLKDYVWKSVRVISKFMLKELKNILIQNINPETKPILNLEDVVDQLMKAELTSKETFPTPTIRPVNISVSQK